MFGIETIVLVFFALIFLWLLSLSFFLFKTKKHYDRISKGISKKSLTSVLEKILSDLTTSQKNLESIDKRLEKQEKESLFKVQKLGLVRFNPFADTGGEQSFIISFLDIYNNGLILTSLQGRSGTRWYAKMVKKGKGVGFELSKEEQEAVKKAKQLKN